jgi:hypothetical protein
MHDRLLEAHARLSSLKVHLQETSTLEDHHLAEFHDILQVLEQASGCDLGGYRISAAAVLAGGGGGEFPGGSDASGEGCGRLLTHIEGVLTFFGVQAAPRHFHPQSG